MKTNTFHIEGIELVHITAGLVAYKGETIDLRIIDKAKAEELADDTGFDYLKRVEDIKKK